MIVETAWTEPRIAQLGEFWRQGLSTAEIGRRLGISKNAVVGKAHRLELPPRPSPIKARPAQPAIAAAPAAKVKPRLVPRTQGSPVKLVRHNGSGPACQWPSGHPGQPDFHFCGRPAAHGKPYCAEHAARAYVGSKSRSDAA